MYTRSGEYVVQALGVPSSVNVALGGVMPVRILWSGVWQWRGQIRPHLDALWVERPRVIMKIERKRGIGPRGYLTWIWTNEEFDFSKWVAEEENLAVLCDEIGIAIRQPEKEVLAGKYSVDIPLASRDKS